MFEALIKSFNKKERKRESERERERFPLFFFSVSFPPSRVHSDQLLSSPGQETGSESAGMMSLAAEAVEDSRQRKRNAK